ncbi:MAG: hypothetical protein IJ867_01540 [Clostridia bacterium]|nr:hypothetical protein [Clostridia bacterium]
MTASETSTGTVTPAYDQTALIYYGIYDRNYTANFYSGVNASTVKEITSSTAYYNSSEESTPTTVSITLDTADSNTDIPNWNEDGFRIDFDPETKEYDYGDTINANWGTDFYSVYSRDLTIKYLANGATGGDTPDTVKTIYLNTYSTETSDQEVILADCGNEWAGYEFDCWALGSNSGTQYAPGDTYNPNFSYDAESFEVTMVARWIGNYIVDDYSYLTLEEAYNAIIGTVGNKEGTIITVRDNTDPSRFIVAVGDKVALQTTGKIITKSTYGIVNNGELRIYGDGKITTVPLGE